MNLVGIDLSTDPKKTGVCVIEDNAVVCVRRGSTTVRHPDWLVDLCAGADVVAVDVPFGWPKPFIEALKGYEIGAALDLPREQYRLRRTDFWVRVNFPPSQPKSVSTDRLGSTAIVGTNLLRALDGMGFRLSPRRSTMLSAVIEVYPTASLQAWSLRHQNSATFLVLDRLREAFDLEVYEADREELLRSSHCFDALIATLTAREYVEGNTFDPPEHVSDETLEVEGWIRVPNRSFADASDM